MFSIGTQNYFSSNLEGEHSLHYNAFREIVDL